MSRLGQKLKELRGEQSLYEVEKLSGIQRRQLLRYETGQMPTLPILHKLADFYQVPYEDLRKLNLDDIFDDPEERRIVKAWALGS